MDLDWPNRMGEKTVWFFFIKNPPAKLRQKKLLHKLWVNYFRRIFVLMLFFIKKDSPTKKRNMYFLHIAFQLLSFLQQLNLFGGVKYMLYLSGDETPRSSFG